MSDKNLIALADSFMAIFGFKRIAKQIGNVITLVEYECECDEISNGETCKRCGPSEERTC